MLHISLAAETIVSVGGFPITNSLLTTWVVMAFLCVVSYLLTRSIKLKPSRTQVVAEFIVGGLRGLFTSLLGIHATSLYPLVATFFLFIITSNWFGLLPGVGTIGFYEKETKSETHAYAAPLRLVYAEEHEAVAETTNESPQVEGEPASKPVEATERKFVPFLRAPTADLNMTVALSLIAFFLIQYYGFKIGGPSYGKKFINISNPIFFFVGILEIISDISKIISFAFRLFGNIFAGEVLLAVMAFLFPLFLPIPFLFMEIFVGFIQALVFAMLVSVFVKIAVSHGDSHHGGEVSHT